MNNIGCRNLFIFCTVHDPPTMGDGGTNTVGNQCRHLHFFFASESQFAATLRSLQRLKGSKRGFDAKCLPHALLLWRLGCGVKAHSFAPHPQPLPECVRTFFLLVNNTQELQSPLTDRHLSISERWLWRLKPCWGCQLVCWRLFKVLDVRPASSGLKFSLPPLILAHPFPLQPPLAAGR